jgi:hypothetical protein
MANGPSGHHQLEHPPTEPSHTIFESAAAFGLSPDEICDTVIVTFETLPEDVKTEYLDELSGALAKRLIAKQRHV